MEYSYNWSDFIGNIGVLLLVGTFALLQFDKIDAKGFWYSFNNFIVAILLLVNLFYKPNISAFEQALQNQLEAHKIDLICLAGFMHILGSNFIASWKGRILNIHPSLLPKYKGLDTHQRAIDAGDYIAGCTVHEVVTELDSGRILARGCVNILSDEDALSLAARVLVQEHLLYPKVVREFIDNLLNKISQ